MIPVVLSPLGPGDGLAQWLERWTGDPKGRGFESRQEHNSGADSGNNHSNLDTSTKMYRFIPLGPFIWKIPLAT